MGRTAVVEGFAHLHLRLGRDRREWQYVGQSAGQANIYANAPYLYDQQPNSINLHQLDLHAIRLPDTYQKDHIDWGFRVDALYGQDYRSRP